MSEPWPSVDLIIPARDEAENLPTVLAALAALPAGVLRRVIVADNGSVDATAARARAGGATVVHESQRGYGAACLAALHWIDSDSTMPPPEVVAFLDADMADDPARLPELLTAIAAGEADFVIGTRVNLAERGALTPVQRFGNALSCRLIRLCTGVRYHDLGPMRAIRADALRAMGMADRTWGWTVEMQFKAAAMGLRVREIDVPYRPRRAGVSKISGSIKGSVKAGTKILSTIARLWWTTPRRDPLDR